MRLAPLFALLLSGAALLSACGQKGPLFIPGDDHPPSLQPEPATAPAAPAPAAY